MHSAFITCSSQGLRTEHSRTPSCKSAPLTLSAALARACRGVVVGAVALALAGSAADPANAYGLINARLEKCKGDSPCVSTSSVGNPSKFGPPWSYQPQTEDAQVAWRSLKDVVETSRDKGVIVESIDGPDTFYMRAEFPAAFGKGIDDVEFRLVKADSLVTYRSASRDAIYLYPLQTPINTNKNFTRLLDIRQALGWEEFAGFNLFGTQ